MSNSDFASLTLQLVLLIGGAHLLGYGFSRLRQPRVIGEILAGVLLGPSVLGRLAPLLSRQIFPQLAGGGLRHDAVLAFLHQLGLLLLMFASGAEARGLFQRQDRREIAWLSGIGTALPFLLTLMLAPLVPLDRLMGTAGARLPLLLVLSIAVSVTSIPVISRIMHDLGILRTRFARLVLGVAVIEDIALWAVLAVATRLAASAAVPRGEIAMHVTLSVIYLAAGLFLLPRCLRALGRSRWNLLATASAPGYLVVVLLSYVALSALLDVNLVFAAFLAGFGVFSDTEQGRAALDSITKFSFAVFIPLYFALVGFRLDLGRQFSFVMLAVFLAAACTIKLLATGMGARIAGFGWSGALNLAVATNARGGPGIVLASVAFDAHIINAAFYTTLVLVAVLTSQAAGAWIERVLRSGRPLLEAEQPRPEAGDTLPAKPRVAA